jgi:hypothetical protein
MPDHLFKDYEPQPPRCKAVRVSEENIDAIADYFNLRHEHDKVMSVDMHYDKKGKSLKLKFVADEYATYEITVMPGDILYRVIESGSRYAVTDDRAFWYYSWRERL